MKSMGDVNNLSSDRMRLTSVADSSSSLERHRSWERIVQAAKKYQRSQEGESSKSFSNDDFTRDNQKMKNLGKQVISHVEQMSTLIREQYNLMHSLNEDFLRLQEGAGKRKKKSSRTTWMSLCAQLPKSPVWENQPGRSPQDLRHQTQVGIGQSRKTVEELMEQAKNCVSPLKDGGEGVIEDWPKIKETIDEFMGCMKSNGETIRSMRSVLGMVEQSETNNQVSALNSDAANLLERAMDDINNLDHLVSEEIFQGYKMLKQKNIELKQENKSLEEDKQDLKQESKSLKEDKQDLKQDKQILRGEIEVVKQKRKILKQMNEFLKQQYEDIKQQQIIEHELKEILKKAKPELSPEVRKAYNDLQYLHSKAMHGYTVSNDAHTKAFEELLGHLSPETLQEHKRRGTEFVINPNAKVFYPEVEKNAEDKWQIKLPLPYKYGVSSMMLRAIDLLLETKHQQAGDIPSPERRADIATRVFRANFMLGQGELGKYGFPIKGYDLAEKYHKDYKDGIRQAFKDGLISKDTQKEEIIEIGHTYAHAKYLESIKPPQDIPRVFPSLQPGAYVEERRIWELNEGQQSVKVGSREFDTLMKILDRRKQKGENFSLTVTILANKEICVQPYYIMEGLRSRHPMTAEGNHCTWAGEVDIDYETKTVTRLKDQSGHYKPFDKDNPDLMARFALEEFKKRGYDTSTTMIELTAIEDSKEFEYNYKPRTREDLKDSGGLTPSELYIDDFWKKHGTNTID